MKFDLEKILFTVAKGPITLSEVARQLGVQLSEAESAIGALLAHGYLREIKAKPCSSCPVTLACKIGRKGLRTFELTEKGAALLRRKRKCNF
ncbi:MAG: hypothetical protein QXY49_05600 [Thermofilaceae archaeon]